MEDVEAYRGWEKRGEPRSEKVDALGVANSEGEKSAAARVGGEPAGGGGCKGLWDEPGMRGCLDARGGDQGCWQMGSTGGQ